MTRTIVLTGEPKSTQHIYRAACHGRFPTTYMTLEGKALKEQYQWEAKAQWKGPVLTGDVSLTVSSRHLRSCCSWQGTDCGGATMHADSDRVRHVYPAMLLGQLVRYKHPAGFYGHLPEASYDELMAVLGSRYPLHR